MSGERDSHGEKSLSDRKYYWDTVIRAKGPTSADTSPIMDTTDQSASTEKAKAIDFVPTKEPSALIKVIQERGIEILIGSILIPLILAGAYQLYSLNRETGEIQSIIQHVKSNVNRIEKELDNHFRLLSDDIDKIERRLDEVVDRQFRNGASANE